MTTERKLKDYLIDLKHEKAEADDLRDYCAGINYAIAMLKDKFPDVWELVEET